MSQNPFELLDRLTAHLGDRAELEQEGTHVYARAKKGREVCDFCSSTPVTHEVLTPDFPLSSRHMSRGHWLACASCAAFVLATDLPALTARIVKVLHIERADQPAIQATCAEVLRLMTGILTFHRGGNDANLSAT